MDAYQADFDLEPRPTAAAAGRWARWLVQGAAMLAVVAVGVAALSLFPRPHRGAPAVEAPAAQVVIAAPPSPAPFYALAPAAEPPAAPVLRPRIASPAGARRPAQRRPPIVVVAARPLETACRTPRVAADRLVCREPFLAAQDRRMREAYRRALAAGADRLEIDRAQARWHGVRDRATQPGDLARLYAQRIAALQAAARNPRRPDALGGGG